MLVSALRSILPRVASAASASGRCCRKFSLPLACPPARRFSTDFGDVPTFELQMDCIDVPDAARHCKTLIFLHGLGDTGSAWSQAFFKYGEALSEKGVKMVFPHSPSLSVTMNDGEYMPAWFDLHGLEDRFEEPCEGLDDSAQVVCDLIEEEAELLGGSEHVMLAGFSQGGALALHIAVHSGIQLCCVAALSAYLPRVNQLDGSEHLSCPTLITHGLEDKVVSPSCAEKTAASLEKICADEGSVLLKMYDVAHAVTEKELQDIVEFMIDKCRSC